MTNYFINTLAWWQWGILALVPPAIIALYFLKLRRPPLEVPSTFLWHRTIEDLHVNSIWQRLRQNLLLFLQLLLIALLIFALLRPGWRGAELSGNRFVFLIDNSASMSATDISPPRLGKAKQEVAELIEAMAAGDVAMLVSFSDLARVEQPFTSNRRLLRSSLERIQPTNRPTNIAEALRVASGLANPGSTADPDNPNDAPVAEALPATVFVVSDGRFPEVTDFDLGNLRPRFLSIGSEFPANVGITAFAPQRNPEIPEQFQVFARLQNDGPNDVEVEVSLHLDDALRDAKQVAIAAGESAGVDFPLTDVDSGVLKLVIEAPDALAVDNTAYAPLNVPRQAKVLLVTPGNDALEKALATEATTKLAEITIGEPALLQTKAYAEQALTGAYDLVIFDQCAPTSMPAANTLWIGSLPPAPKPAASETPPAANGEAPEKAADAPAPDAAAPNTGPEAVPDAAAAPADGKEKDARIVGLWTAGEPVTAPQIIDTDRAHPLMQYVELGNVQIAEAAPLTLPPGGTALVDSDIGPIAAIAPREGFEDVVLGFEIVGYDAAKKQRYANTDWPIRRSFPLFVINLLNYLGGRGAGLTSESVPPGRPVLLRSDSPVDQITVRSPSGRNTQIDRQGRGAFAFAGTEELGVYEVREGSSKQVSQLFAVNLMDSNESNLAPRNVLPVGGEEVAAQTAWDPVRKEIWKYLVMLGLVVLLVEWYIYNRRVYL